MSTGFDAIPLLKAAPDPEQIAERLAGGVPLGIELCLGPRDVESPELIAAVTEAARTALPERDCAVTAEAPVSWPSGAHVRVDRLDDEARAGIERSAEFAEGVGSPVLTIHLFTPKSPEEFRSDWRPDGARGCKFCAAVRRSTVASFRPATAPPLLMSRRSPSSRRPLPKSCCSTWRKRRAFARSFAAQLAS